MTRFVWTIPGVAAVFAVAAFAPQALATSQTNGVQPTSTPMKSSDLPTVTVYGYRLPLPVELQMYKNALSRSWSSTAAERNTLVCRWRHVVGTHIDQRLFCMTNRQHQQYVDGLSISFTNAQAAYRTRGNPAAFTRALRHGVELQAFSPPPEVSGRLVALSQGRFVTRGSFAPILKRLPAANSSYTFRVTDHGKPVLDYVFKNGKLVHIYHYVYKNGDESSRASTS